MPPLQCLYTNAHSTGADCGLTQGSAWQDPIGYGLKEQQSAGELVDFQKSPSPSPKPVHPDMEDIKGSCQQACVDRQGAPDKTQL